jgi:acyl carrier protein
MACAGVYEAAVVVRRNEAEVPRCLVAYAVLQPETRGLLPRHLEAMLKQRLPAHMLPAAIFIVDALPRLPTLKIDRARLAESDAAQAVDPAIRRPGSLVDRVAEAFERLLGITGVTPDDTLSTLGGDSLQAAEIVLELERRFAVELSIDIFATACSISDLASWISGKAAPAEHGPPRPTEEVREIATALREKRPLDVASRKRADWGRAIELLGSAGDLETAVRGVRTLRARYPQSEFARNMCELFDRMPAAGGQLPFTDDVQAEVQIVPHPHAADVILLFCGGSHALGISLSAIHRWLGCLPASLVYLRDFRRSFYLQGLSSLGTNLDETLAALRRIVASLNGERVFCYGVSAGTYPALRYGLGLGAEAVIGLAGIIDLDLTADMAVRRTITRLRKELPDAATDLRRAYAAARRPPRAHLVYGEANWDDRLHAESLSGLPTVTLDPLPACTVHNVTAELIRRDQYEPLLRNFLAA